MKKTIRYTNEPMDDVRIVEDFLSSPKHHTQYQKLIRRLLDEYAVKHKSVS